MIYKMHQSSGDTIGFHLSGKLTDDDYWETLVPELEQAVEQWGKINLLLEMEDFHGPTSNRRRL